MSDASKFAVVANLGGDDNQSLLARAAETWRCVGHRIVGVLAEQQSDEDAVCSAGFLRDIASGRRFTIAFERPPIGTACHLDAKGMETACAQLLDQIPSSDAVVLSKFGKLEAGEQGLWPAFSMAFTLGKPVLTTVSSKHLAALRVFAPAAVWLEPDPASLTQWWESMAPNFSSDARRDARGGLPAA